MSAHESLGPTAGIPLEAHVKELHGRCEASARVQGCPTHYWEELRLFREYAKERNLYLQHPPEEIVGRNPDEECNEHQVWFVRDSQWVIKVTWPDNFGLLVLYRADEEERASPYLERWHLYNELFGDSVGFIGALEADGKLQLVIEQPAIKGEPASLAQFHDFFVNSGWRRFSVGGDPHTREKLEKFIGDYNAMFGTAFSTKDTQSFYNYYQDIAKKVKERKVDLLLVVNMFLTGFDSKTLNTLWVDKNLKHHGLIQAYSRTNRILNEVKCQGNIVVFRNLKARTDEAIALFSNVKAKETIFVPPYEDYVKQFNAVVMDLLELTPTVKSVRDLKDEEAELKFVKIFRELMRLRNILESFSEFQDDDLTLPAQRFADYRSAYLDLYDKVKTDTKKEKVSILNDVDFELELIHRDVINVQYILQLLAKLYGANAAEAPAIKKLILDSVTGDIELRSKKGLIEKFIEQNLPKVEDAAQIPETFETFWEAERVDAFNKLVKEEELDADKLKKVIDRYVYTGQEPLPDPDIAELITKPLKILERGPTKQRVFERVVNYVATFIRGMAA